MSEIDQEFKKLNKKVIYTFNPHLLPTFRGILTTIYLNKHSNVSIVRIKNELQKFYKIQSLLKYLK